MAGPTDGVRVRLWDAPVRVFHWLVVGLVAFAWWSAEDHLNWHRWAGYAVIGLVLFRIYWGFAGPAPARFSHFVKGPGATLAYLRTLSSREPSLTPGHNPVGALSVVAILATLAVQVGTGLFAVDIDAFEGGPLSDRISFELGRQVAEWHELSFRVLQALVVLHLAAIAYYGVWKRTNLVRPMVTGVRMLPSDPGFSGAPWWRFLLGAVAAGALAWWASKGLRL